MILNLKYVLFAVFSLVLNLIISIFICKKKYKAINKDFLICLFIETIGIVLGAKILDIIFNYNVYSYLLEEKKFLNIFTSGYTFLGGVFGAVFFIFMHVIITKKEPEKYFEILVPNLILVYSIAKIGCFFTGCCGGIEINGYRFPIQLIESIIYFSIWLFLTIYKKIFYDKISSTCILFGSTRFLIEFLRERYDVTIISLSQVLALFILLIGIVILVLNFKSKMSLKN